MTLDELIQFLEAMPGEMRVDNGLGEAHSYRGWYDCLAFEPCGSRTVAEILSDAPAARGQTFRGYKGGEYLMGGNTPVFIAMWGTADPYNEPVAADDLWALFGIELGA